MTTASQNHARSYSGRAMPDQGQMMVIGPYCVGRQTGRVRSTSRGGWDVDGGGSGTGLGRVPGSSQPANPRAHTKTRQARMGGSLARVLLWALVLCAAPTVAQAQISYIASAGLGDQSGLSTTATVSDTNATGADVAYYFIGWRRNGTQNISGTPTHNGNNMTHVLTRNDASGMACAVYRITAAATTFGSSDDVSATFSAEPGYHSQAVIYLSGVDQSTPEAGSAEDGGDNDLTTTVTLGAGDWAVDGTIIGVADAITNGGDQTVRCSNGGGNCLTENVTYQITSSATSGTQTQTWATNVRSCKIAVAVNVSAGGGGGGAAVGPSRMLMGIGR